MPGASRPDEKKAEEAKTEKTGQTEKKESTTADLTWGVAQVLLPVGVVISAGTSMLFFDFLRA